MIDRSRLRDLHDATLPLHILEQDYIQALFLQELYQETADLVFKGGTYLKHVHGLDRYSEDLDFTMKASMGVEERLQTTASALDRYGISATVDRFDRQEHAILSRLRYQGPLFDGTDRSRGSIELDISTRNDVIRDPQWMRLFFPYPETRAVTALCLPIEEALAEKLRALSTRARGRDLYDMWFLLQQGTPIEPLLFEQKMATLDEPAHVSISVGETEWKRDLSVLLSKPPDYDDVLTTVVPALRDEGLSVSSPNSG